MTGVHRSSVGRNDGSGLLVHLKRIKRATFLCPTMTSGGPEAIHQAAQAFNAAGLTSDIAYFWNGGVQVDGDQLVCQPPAVNPCLDVYAQYEPVICRGLPLRERHLVVLPETLAGHFALFKRATVAIWWLSVDNMLKTTDLRSRQALLSDRSVLHFHQSAYAEDYLRRAGAASAPLSDFTTPEFTTFELSGPNTGTGVAYNPAKGAELAAEFFAANPQHVPVPVQGMSRLETTELFRRTPVYVDFGHFPGKDRMPREAAASGAIVFLRDAGAGRFQEDFPVPDFFRFTDEDVSSGELARRIAATREDPLNHWEQQRQLRDDIRREHERLREQVAALRGTRLAA